MTDPVTRTQILAAVTDLTARVNAGLMTQQRALDGIDAAVAEQAAKDQLVIDGLTESLRETTEQLATARATIALDQETIAALNAKIVELQEALDECEQGHEEPLPKTLFGTFSGPLRFPNTSPVETKADMRSRVNGALGPLAVERIFNEGSWTVPAAGLSAIVSFSQNPVAVARGDFDAQITAFVQALDPDTTYWLCLNHECDQTTRSYTAAEQVAGFKHFSDVVRAVGKPNVKLATILMSWTLTQGGPDHWRDWYPGTEYVDALGWDAYWRPNIPHTVDDIYGKAWAVTQAEGKEFLICETSIGAQGHGGSMDDKGTPVPEETRTAFVRDAIAYLDGKAAAVTWFETNKTDGNWLAEGHPDAVALLKGAIAASRA